MKIKERNEPQKPTWLTFNQSNGSKLHIRPEDVIMIDGMTVHHKLGQFKMLDVEAMKRLKEILGMSSNNSSDI